MICEIKDSHSNDDYFSHLGCPTRPESLWAKTKCLVLHRQGLWTQYSNSGGDDDDEDNNNSSNNNNKYIFTFFM